MGSEHGDKGVTSSAASFKAFGPQFWPGETLRCLVLGSLSSQQRQFVCRLLFTQTLQKVQRKATATQKHPPPCLSKVVTLIPMC